VESELDLALLRRFEPILHFTRGEQFFPIDVERYVRVASLWEQRPGEGAVCLVESNHLDLERLAVVDATEPNTVQFLKFSEPLAPAEVAAYYLQDKQVSKENRFRPGTGRLARVGYASRFVDALFTVTLLARGRVPGDTAAAAEITYRRMMAEQEEYRYHARVVREAGWVVLQYWYFYAFNNWRSGFSGANDHEADWEMVCIYLTENGNEEPDYQNQIGVERQLDVDEDQDPVVAAARRFKPHWMAYASHDDSGDDLRRRWDDPEVSKVGDHPIVFVGAGSHASYFRRGEYLTEIELSFLSPLMRVLERFQDFWHGQLRQYQSDGPAQDAERASNILRVAFVDYARGNGLAVGPGQEQEWMPPRLLDEQEGWLANYRGLWGLYTRDPFAGENAPGGPMHNRDRTVRRVWYDPVGWAGLDKVPPPEDRLSTVLGKQADVCQQLENLQRQISEKKMELRRLSVAAEAMREESHLQKVLQQVQGELDQSSEALGELRRQEVEAQELLEALKQHEVRVRAGEKGPLRAHIRHAHVPTPEEVYRAGRLAEIWAAASIGLMMLTFVAMGYFAREYIIFGLVALVGMYVFIEATFRGRVTRLVASVTIGLAIISALVLIYEFFWGIVAGSVLLIGAYLLWQNLSELRQ
jgi:hypothetical protein